MDDPLADYAHLGLTWDTAMARARTLAEEAAKRVRREPDIQLVGIVATPDANEVKDSLPALGAAGRAPDWVYFLVTREQALAILRGNHPAALDWLEPKTSGPERRLPILVIARLGIRAGYQPFVVEPGPE